MRFSAFIESNLDEIVAQWTGYARALFPATATMTKLALEDHARDLLTVIVKDMETSQSEKERFKKSEGKSAEPFNVPETAAYTHGVVRQLSGFKLDELVSEYRALRASVLKLWSQSDAHRSSETAVNEIARFNEGLDQALAESIQSCSEKMAQSRDMFLAVLGHDVRGPLSGIQMAAEVLKLPNLAEPVRLKTAERIHRASAVINRLTTDLLEYARSRLGSGIPVERSDCDLRDICEHASDAVKAAHPELVMVTECSGDLRIRCDIARMQQALGNLLNNAVQPGDSSKPISLDARREPGAVVLAVTNQGHPIPEEAFTRIFDPLISLPPERNEAFEQRSRVGLGLFIVREIVEGHGGTITVESSVERTVFTVRLPDQLAIPEGPQALPAT